MFKFLLENYKDFLLSGNPNFWITTVLVTLSLFLFAFYYFESDKKQGFNKKEENFKYFFYSCIFSIFLVLSSFNTSWIFYILVKQESRGNYLILKQAVAYETVTIRCEKTSGSNPCEAVYNCNSHKCNCRTVDGKRKCDTCYDKCPYCQEEMQYREIYADGTYYVVDGNQIPENFKLWDEKVPLPNNVKTTVGVGTPIKWTEYQELMYKNQPRVVAFSKSYNNPFVAYGSYEPSLEKVGNVNTVETAFNYPDPPIFLDSYQTPKVITHIGIFDQSELTNWRVNSAILSLKIQEKYGTELKIVLINDRIINSNIDEYVTGLKQNWTNIENRGTSVIHPDTLVLVISSEDGKTIANARVFTGFPARNEEISQKLNLNFSLKGKALAFNSISPLFEIQKSEEGKVSYSSVENKKSIIESFLMEQNFEKAPLSDYNYLNYQSNLGVWDNFQLAIASLIVTIVNIIMIVMGITFLIYLYEQYSDR